MTAIYLLFFLSAFILFYNYAGYGILLLLLTRIKKRFSPASAPDASFEPHVSLVVAAYNEEADMPAKIANTLALDYPAHKLEIIFITDGSTDNTPAIIAREKRIRLLHEDIRSGKTAAINRAMQHVTAPVVIFCDANTMLNREAVRNIVKHYADDSVGGVAGEKRVMSRDTAGAAATENLYWKYESFLKKLDADLYSVVGAAGELFSVRTQLYRPVEEQVILDDFVISLRVNMQGYRIAYAPDAYALEAPSFSITEEHKRKVRISAGGFQSIVMLKGLLNFFKYPVLSFQYISHRVLRWTLCPLSLPVLFVTNAALAVLTPYVIFKWLLVAQVLFYVLAMVGYAQALRQKKSKLSYIPFYFLFMNVAVYQGFSRYMKKSQSAVWERSKRS
ncbi:glycosyltransferase family 2 protein [Chitinophaga cymbidii]|uniref:Glycosyl transferase n=1 Tax=Chitinophaga cymbidii TaxID=1096750 RepID=A0A512RRP4_9BACT|nr:glycosyltransferase family 2 protein [Chitinophaga cymbidii]GEP98354.1 glycosyl transferase [Chitinophaga cymbidii]